MSNKHYLFCGCRQTNQDGKKTTQKKKEKKERTEYKNSSNTKMRFLRDCLYSKSH